MGLDSKLFLDFLSRPRTITEVAERFNIPVSLAEQIILEAVEDGKVLVSTGPAGRDTRSVGLGKSHSKEVLSFSPRSFAVEKSRVRGEPFTIRPVGFPLTAKPNNAARLLLKLKESKPFPVRRSKPRVTLEPFGERKKAVRGKPPFSMRLDLLEALRTEAKPLMELRGRFGISKNALRVLVRRGLLCSDWGPKGVGVLYKLTEDGNMELKRLKEASRIDAGLVRKPLVTLKTRMVH